MTRKSDSQEPLLNAVARRLGQAAGTVANLTHVLTSAPGSGRSHPPSNRESVRSSSRQPESANSGSVPAEANSASLRRSRTAKQRKASPKKQARRPGTAPRKSTVATKRISRRKR